MNFINKYMKVKSFDNISAFLDEVVLFEDIPLTQIAKDMNISTEKIKEEDKVSTQDDTQSSDMDEVCIEIMENKILNPF